MKTREGAWRSTMNGRKMAGVGMIALLWALLATPGIGEQALAAECGEIQAENQWRRYLDLAPRTHNPSSGGFSGSNHDYEGGSAWNGEGCGENVMLIFSCELAGGTWNPETCGCDAGGASASSPGEEENGDSEVMLIFSCELAGGTWSPMTRGCEIGESGDGFSGGPGEGESDDAEVIFSFSCELAGGIWDPGTLGCEIDDPADARAPEVRLAWPSNNSVLSGRVVARAEADDNVGVASVRFLVDGRGRGVDDVRSPYNAVFDTTTLSNGAHTIRVVVRDVAGNASISEGVTVIVENDAGLPDPGQVFLAGTDLFSRVHSVPIDGPAVLNPALEFTTGLQGLYDCYAAVVVDGFVYFASENMHGEIIFQRYEEGEAVQTFKKRKFLGHVFWTCDAFKNLGPIQASVAKEHGVYFLIAAAPENGGPAEGALFTFVEENG